jgi:hypothetical protein
MKTYIDGVEKQSCCDDSENPGSNDDVELSPRRRTDRSRGESLEMAVSINVLEGRHDCPLSASMFSMESKS